MSCCGNPCRCDDAASAIMIKLLRSIIIPTQGALPRPRVLLRYFAAVDPLMGIFYLTTSAWHGNLCKSSPWTRAGKWLRKILGFKCFFCKNLKTSKDQNLGFYLVVRFYTDHIKFHILIVICEFWHILQKIVWERKWYNIGFSYSVETCLILLNFVHSNSKKNL